MWSLLLDPNTGTFEVVDGRLSTCSRALAKAISATTTHKGSVPGFESFGIDPTVFSHTSTVTPSRVEAEIDRVLGPMVGVDFISYEATAWVDESGFLYFQISVLGPDAEAEESATIKVSG